MRLHLAEFVLMVYRKKRGGVGKDEFNAGGLIAINRRSGTDDFNAGASGFPRTGSIFGELPCNNAISMPNCDPSCCLGIEGCSSQSVVGCAIVRDEGG